jgi:tripartite-type tricarboxylate transporter receptor subunit TctC
VVVPAASPYQTLADLIADLKKDPGAVSWPADRPAAPTTSPWG